MNMHALSPQRSGSALPSQFDGARLSLIRRTVAKDCTEDEFSVFIDLCRSLKLDPLRKQVVCEVRNKATPSRRELVLVTPLTGLRTIADRTGNYRPDEDEPELVTDSALLGPSNPLGLVKATVRVHKHSHGAWHKITGTAWWDEMAPVKDRLKIDQTGQYVPTGEKVLDQRGGWPRMGRIMLAKCAESNALRRGWPDELSNVYVEEEMDRQRFIEFTAAEIAAAGEAERQNKLASKDMILVDWLDGDTSPLVPVLVGEFSDRVVEFVKANEADPARISAWRARNSQAMHEFWGLSRADALDLKGILEQAQEVRHVDV